jgi:hypothetical protein
VRYIDLDLVLRDPQACELIDAAEEVREKVLAEPDDAKRRALIAANRSTWVRFRPLFERTYGGKCWYTESKNPGTDDDVDHYRPKSQVAESSEHGGYWWEAFSWRNFRLSCHRANRRRANPDTGTVLGKGDSFPLIDESRRWCSPEHVCHEEPVLLDPTDPEDPPLLTFDIDGRTAIAPPYQACETAVRRVEVSREILHLDWPAFVDDRRDLYARVYARVLTGDRAEEAKLKGEASAGEAVKTAAKDLIRLTADREPYSRAAVAYIRRFRDRRWVERAVLPHIPEVT